MPRQCHNCDSQMVYSRSKRQWSCECGATHKAAREANGKRMVAIATYPQSESQHAVDKAVWSTAEVNDLPDASFLYIESGGEKDEDGKTTPRSLRHFPVKDADGKVDLPHLRNALARIPQSDLPQDVKDEATAKAKKLLEEASAKKSFAAEGDLLRKVDETPGTTLHYVCNVVLSPGTPEATRDSQGDYYTDADIWAAQRSFQKSRQMGLCHVSRAQGVTILHDYVALADFEFGGQVIKAGSWVLGIEIDESHPDGAKLWADILSGQINAFSIGGTGRREELSVS